MPVSGSIATPHTSGNGAPKIPSNRRVAGGMNCPTIDGFAGFDMSSATIPFVYQDE
uniref:Uncharacterized protein n=1 Tax=uncultured actinobacterium Rifle_16ft_4_minimus_12599 TaxID=1665144 RepID=A0A0H4T2N6_9ACTN|nr:hypothetical protein [uncultured actinobacterium Rifle_16ft_4_minimus_12599]